MTSTPTILQTISAGRDASRPNARRVDHSRRPDRTVLLEIAGPKSRRASSLKVWRLSPMAWPFVDLDRSYCALVTCGTRHVCTIFVRQTPCFLVNVIDLTITMPDPNLLLTLDVLLAEGRVVLDAWTKPT